MTDKTLRIIDRLADIGIASNYVCGVTAESDGEVRITPTISVQVGADYLIAYVSDSATQPTQWRFYPTRSYRQLSLLAEDIKMAAIYNFDAEPVFERVDKVWLVKIYRGPDGGSIIERLRARKGLFPLIWQLEITPEAWVGMQPNKAKYRKVEQETSCA